MFALLATVYAAVLAAELLGDKTLYTVGTLATRYRVLPVLLGAAVAVTAKMLVAVMFLGSILAALPPAILPIVSCSTFLAMAILVWLRKPSAPAPVGPPRHWALASVVSFGAIFFTEWGDLGQLAAAMLAAEHHELLIVWIGASLAMLTKVLLALTVGIGIRRWVPFNIVRIATASLCLVMAILAATDLVV